MSKCDKDCLNCKYDDCIDQKRDPAYYREYYKNNKKRIMEARRKYREKNREKIREYQRKWRNERKGKKQTDHIGVSEGVN